MVRVLIADNDIESLELVDDLIGLNFREAKIEQALTGTAFLRKLDTAEKPFNLILLNPGLELPGGESVVEELQKSHAELLERIVFLASGPSIETFGPIDRPVLRRPFSLDLFGEVVVKACVY
jgi:hypothetical protein